jgi:hypothetical protein
LELTLGGDVGVKAIADPCLGSPRVAAVDVVVEDGRLRDREGRVGQVELLDDVCHPDAGVEATPGVAVGLARRRRSGAQDERGKTHCVGDFHGCVVRIRGAKLPERPIRG